MSAAYIPGTRVPERIVRGLIADGLSAEEIAGFYPSVTAEHVAALGHCEGHGGPGRWRCCRHPHAGWPCEEKS